MFICFFCFHFTFTVNTNVLNTVVFMVRKVKKKQFKSEPPLPQLLKFSVFSNPPVIILWIFFQLPLIFHTHRLLEIREYVAEIRSTCDFWGKRLPSVTWHMIFEPSTFLRIPKFEKKFFSKTLEAHISGIK